MTPTLTRPQSPAADQRFLFDEADWAFYASMLDRLGDRHVFVTYDRGRMEIMSPSRKHDKCGRILGLVVHILADELNLPLDGGGSTTFRREDLDRGLEPDECFYIRNEPLVRGKEEIDLTIDPPPDLAIEVEISRRLLDRQAIYAALGVPELWCHDGTHLRVLVLSADGKYARAERSPTFPTLALPDVDRFVQMAWTTDETTWARSFRAWVKRELAPR